jgi:hypothetical protein
MPTAVEQEVLAANQQLLKSIAEGNWEAYAKLCDPSITCFEAETRGNLAAGMEFHKFYFDLGPSTGPVTNTMCCPHVRVIGDGAVVSYVRLTQRLDAEGKAVTARSEETRVWQRIGGAWKHVHFHRSAAV